MPSIGHVQRQNDGSFRGALKTLSVNAEIAIIPNRSKTGDQPDYRGGRPLYANLGRAAGQDDDDAFAVIWNPGD